MIIYHLSFVPSIRHAALIYVNYHFDYQNFNMYMYSLSKECHDELYHGAEPNHKSIRYYMAKLIVGRIGKVVLSNYSRFLYCSSCSESSYNHQYDKLPKSYKRKLVED